MNLSKIFFILLILYTSIFIICGFGAPFAAYFKDFKLANDFYTLMALSCHQNPLRSFWILNYPMALCARCIGIYTGTIFTSTFVLFQKIKVNRTVIIALCSVVLFEFFFKNTLVFMFNNQVRFVNGVICGFMFVLILNLLFERLNKVMNNENQ